MSQLRPECKTSHDKIPVADRVVLHHLRQAVGRRRSLGHGALKDDNDRLCAMGCLWADNPRLVVSTPLVDQIALVNDSVPPTASPKERWQHVMRWLRWKVGY